MGKFYSSSPLRLLLSTVFHLLSSPFLPFFTTSLFVLTIFHFWKRCYFHSFSPIFISFLAFFICFDDFSLMGKFRSPSPFRLLLSSVLSFPLLPFFTLFHVFFVCVDNFSFLGKDFSSFRSFLSFSPLSIYFFTLFLAFYVCSDDFSVMGNDPK